MSWGSLGDYTFETIGGPLEEVYKWAVDVAEHAVLGRKGRLQHNGVKLQELTLRIRLHSSINASPEANLKALKDHMESGEILDLVVGEQADQGLWAGQWLITTMDLGTIERWPGGKIRNLEVTVTLKEWVEPSGLTISARTSPAKAVKKKGAVSPAIAAGPGYEGGKAPGANQ